MVSPVANGTIILPTRQVLMNAPSILRRPCHLAADGLGPVPGGCGVLQVVKTAQSRGRTERTLFFQHFRNYCGAIKVARCGFPWEKTTKRPVASVYTNCETALTAADGRALPLPFAAAAGAWLLFQLDVVGIHDSRNESWKALVDFRTPRGVLHLYALTLAPDQARFSERLEVLREG